MTDEEILATADACGMMLFGLGMDKAKFEFCILAFAKQVAKLEQHHECEALAQEQALQALHSENERLGLYKDAYAKQEPVKIIQYNCTCGRTMKFESAHGVVAPQRTWVGLTDEEYKDLHLQMGPVYYYQEYGQAIEAKLKEKNSA